MTTCANPDRLERERGNVGDGWQPLIDECISICDEAPEWEIQQIKEKFGTLRFYFSHKGEGDWFERVYIVEGKSAHVCEECGEPGTIRQPTGRAYGWLRCLCPEHHAERDEQEPL